MDAASILKSVLRTVIPWLAACIITFGAKAGLNIDGETAVMVAYLLIGSVYFTGSRIIETRFPGLGRALLSFGLVKSKPVYLPPAAAQSVADVSASQRLQRSP